MSWKVRKRYNLWEINPNKPGEAWVKVTDKVVSYGWDMSMDQVELKWIKEKVIKEGKEYFITISVIKE